MQSQVASKLFRVNTLSRCVRRNLSEVKPEAVKPPQESPYIAPGHALGDNHKVNNLERYFLVWTKKFKHVKDVPAYVSRDTMERSRNIMRIRVNLSLIFLALSGAFGAMYLGRKAAAEGQSLLKMNEAWHKAYNKAQEAKEAKKE